MVIYIAGKITGDPDYRAKFAAKQEELEAKGATVFSPAVLPDGMLPQDYMRICFTMIDRADLVVFLPDWTDSKGACLEFQYCNYIGKPVEIYRR